MPVYNGFSLEKTADGLRTSPKGLAAAGPVIQVQIEAPSALAAAFQKASQPIPKPVEGFALIDTGASITSIDVKIMALLDVNPVGTVQVGTAGGASVLPTFPVRLTFPGTEFPGFESATALGCDLTGQMLLDGKPIIALIGRDLLMECVLVYNGAAGMFSLSM